MTVAINYKEYDENIDITSVIIPISSLYKRLALSSSNLNIGEKFVHSAKNLYIQRKKLYIRPEKVNIQRK